MPSFPVTFYYPYPDELARIDDLDLTDWEFWSAAWLSRRRGWVLRTYLQLRDAGHPVDISATIPDAGIVVLGPEMADRAQFAAAVQREQLRHLYIVSIRADLLRCTFADASVVQNGRAADNHSTFYIPHWPQPGLLPREEARGTTVENIAFKGYLPNLDPRFQSPDWHEFLDAHDLTLHCDANTGGDAATPIAWHDYRTTDLILAVRPDFPALHPSKPATKLYNAWHAGVPAILGPEYAYRELRESPLDYIEVDSIEETKEAIVRLTSDPELYRAMVENGRRRAADFTFDRITEQWAELLFSTLPSHVEDVLTRPRRGTSILGRRLKNLARTPPSRDEQNIWLATLKTDLDVLVHARLRPWLGRTRRRIQSYFLKILPPD